MVLVLRSVHGVRVAVDLLLIGSSTPWEAVFELYFAASGAFVTADWLALSRLPALLVTVISGVGDRSRSLIGSSVLAALALATLGGTRWLSFGVTGLYPGFSR